MNIYYFKKLSTFIFFSKSFFVLAALTLSTNVYYNINNDNN